VGAPVLNATGGESVGGIVKFDFYGDELDVVVTRDGDHLVVLARLCERLGVRDVKSQIDKLRALPWSRWGIIPARDAGGRTQALFCLDIRSVAGWLFTLNAGKMRHELSGKLATYQRDCAEVLADHFIGKRGASAAEVDKLSSRVQALTEERDSARLQCMAADRQLRLVLTSQRSTICDAEFAQLRGILAEVVDLWLALGRGETARAALQLVKHRAIPGAFGKGFRLRLLPRDQVPGVLRALEMLRSDAEAEAKRLGLLPKKSAAKRHPVLNLRK